MDKLLVGSRCVPLKVAEECLGRNVDNSDYDYIMTWNAFQNFIDDLKSHSLGTIHAIYPLNDKKWVIKASPRIIEVEIAWEGSTAEELLSIMSTSHIRQIDLLYTLKCSHKYLRNNPHFNKTMNDIFKLQEFGAKIPEELEEWFKKREAETYHYGHPSLNTDKGNFFNTEGVTYKYDHDSLHEAVKFLYRPAYQYFKPENSEVWCDRDMFEGCCHATQIEAVLEESLVLALERSLIPHDNWDNQQKVILYALEKVCTSITSGWFREFAWNNYYECRVFVEDLPQDYLHTKFQRGLKNGTIKLHNQEN